MLSLLAEAVTSAEHDMFMLPWWLVTILGGIAGTAIAYQAWEKSSILKMWAQGKKDHKDEVKTLKGEVATAHEKVTDATIKKTETDGKFLTALATMEKTMTTMEATIRQLQQERR